MRLKGPQHAFLILFELDDAADGAAAAPAAAPPRVSAGVSELSRAALKASRRTCSSSLL